MGLLPCLQLREKLIIDPRRVERLEGEDEEDHGIPDRHIVDDRQDAQRYHAHADRHQEHHSPDRKCFDLLLLRSEVAWVVTRLL